MVLPSLLRFFVDHAVLSTDDVAAVLGYRFSLMLLSGQSYRYALVIVFQ